MDKCNSIINSIMKALGVTNDQAFLIFKSAMESFDKESRSWTEERNPKNA